MQNVKVENVQNLQKMQNLKTTHVENVQNFQKNVKPLSFISPRFPHSYNPSAPSQANVSTRWVWVARAGSQVLKPGWRSGEAKNREATQTSSMPYLNCYLSFCFKLSFSAAYYSQPSTQLFWHTNTAPTHHLATFTHIIPTSRATTGSPSALYLYQT